MPGMHDLRDRRRLECLAWLDAQIGCGNSFLASEDTAPPAADIAPGLFREELGAVKAALGLSQTRHHVLGHGWGGMLALDALAHSSTPEQRGAVASLSLASVPPSYARLVADRQRRVRFVVATLSPAYYAVHDCCSTAARCVTGTVQRGWLCVKHL